MINKCEKVKITLPKHFIYFFSNQDYLSRFRTDDLLFFTHYGIIPFPEDEEKYIVPFFGDSQGFCWWSLLLDKNSNHCVIYNNYHWLEQKTSLGINEPPPKYIICSDSFSEFIVRLSFDMRTKEGENNLSYL